jgi:hypothetical protein
MTALVVQEIKIYERRMHIHLNKIYYHIIIKTRTRKLADLMKKFTEYMKQNSQRVTSKR